MNEGKDSRVIRLMSRTPATTGSFDAHMCFPFHESHSGVEKGIILSHVPDDRVRNCNRQSSRVPDPLRSRFCGAKGGTIVTSRIKSIADLQSERQVVTAPVRDFRRRIPEFENRLLGPTILN